MNAMVVFWLVCMVALFIVEAIVPGLVSIWFAFGALAALLAALLHGPVWLQISWFFIVSILLLIFTKPFVKKMQSGRIQPTNADSVIGKDCVVTEEVNNLYGTGAVSAGGKLWTARNEKDDVISHVGEIKTVVRIEGVKLIIR